MTGSYAVVKGKYGHRAGDKPLWWVISYHAAKAVIQIITAILLLGIVAWGKRCGVQIDGIIP